MKKKQKILTVISGEGKFIAPNRKTAKFMEAKDVEFTRVKGIPKKNGTKNELSAFKKELAKAHGSKTGKLKKKHLGREVEANREPIDSETMVELMTKAAQEKFGGN